MVDRNFDPLNSLDHLPVVVCYNQAWVCRRSYFPGSFEECQTSSTSSNPVGSCHCNCSCHSYSNFHHLAFWDCAQMSVYLVVIA